MAVYRTIHISFWQDPFILKLTPEEKYFYIYLMTNSKTNQLGCYETAKEVIRMETGYNDETVDKLINRFVGYKKIQFSESTGEMFLLNWHKHSWSKSPTVEACIKKELCEVKNQSFYTTLNSLCIQYGYSMNSLGRKKEETKEETKTENNIYKDIVEYLNQKLGSAFKSSSKATQKHINARLADRYTLDNFKTVIDKKVTEWKDDAKMSQYLRPETLFGNKFEGYLNQKDVKPKVQPNKFNQHEQREYTPEYYAELEKKLLNKGQGG